MEKNKITVFVAGHKLTLITEESEKYVTDIASKVETAVNSLFSASNMSKEKCAVMAALDFCDDEFKSRAALNEIKEQIKDYIEDSANLRAEIEALKAENAKLKGEKEELLKSKKTMIASAVEIKKEKKTVEEIEISSDDDLFFDDEDIEETIKEAEKVLEVAQKTIKEAENSIDVQEEIKAEEKVENEKTPAPKSDKKRHSHEHVNPYKEKALQKNKNEKGYTPVRQYSLFDEE